MDTVLVNLLAEGEGFLLSLAKHEQDEVIEGLSLWQSRVEDYVANMPEHVSAEAQQKGASLVGIAQRLAQAFSQQADWIQKQHSAQRQQHSVAQKYTQNA